MRVRLAGIEMGKRAVNVNVVKLGDGGRRKWKQNVCHKQAQVDIPLKRPKEWPAKPSPPAMISPCVTWDSHS